MFTITVIVKPTLRCNVRCNHCLLASKKGVDLFEEEAYVKGIKVILTFLDAYFGKSIKKVELVWHGGEPMLMGPKFFYGVSEKLRKSFSDVTFKHGIQTNLTLYDENWKRVFEDVFEWRVSTSYDFFSNLRPYSFSFFLKKLREFQDHSGKRGYVICVLNEQNLSKVLDACEVASRYEFDLKLNCLYYFVNGTLVPGISLRSYFNALSLVLENRERFKNVRIDPVDLFLEFTTGKILRLPCPFSSDCVDKIFAIFPDGGIYKCGVFGDVGLGFYGKVDEGINPELFFKFNLSRIRWGFERSFSRSFYEKERNLQSEGEELVCQKRELGKELEKHFSFCFLKSVS